MATIKEQVVKRLLDELPRCMECEKVLIPKGNPLWVSFYCDNCREDCGDYDGEGKDGT